MIIGIWKPVFKGSNYKKNKEIILYEIYGYEELKMKRHKGYIVTYKCDKCKSDEIHKTYSGVLFSSVYNTIVFQICRSCRSRISEYEIKKTQVDFKIIKKSFINSNYQLITTEIEYNNSNKRSQYKLLSLCNKGHEYKCTWNNWDKGKRCRKCYEDAKKENAIRYKDGYELYYYLVRKETDKNYKKYKNILNPNNLKRSRKINIDHIYSIYDGFNNNIPVYIISSIQNLRLISSFENNSKGKKSDISLDELFSKIF